MTLTRDEKNSTEIQNKVPSPIDNTSIIINGKVRTPSPSPERKISSPIIRAESPISKIEDRVSPIISTPKKNTPKPITPMVTKKSTPVVNNPSTPIVTKKSTPDEKKREITPTIVKPSSPIIETEKKKQPRPVIARSPRPASPVNSYSESPKKRKEENSYSEEPVRVIAMDKKKPPIKNRREEKDSSEELIKQSSPVTVKPVKISASPMGVNKPEVVKPVSTSTEVQPVGTNGKPDYGSMSRDEQSKYMNEFLVKLNILKRSHPEFGFQDFPEGMLLTEIHDRYASYVKQVVISLNCSQWRFYLIVGFLALEAFGTKVLGLNMKDYTMSQLATINKYDSLLTEIGEKYYIAGSSAWSPEVKLLFMGASSAVVFIIIKYLTTYIGGESMAPTLQRAIEGIMNGSFSGNSANSLPSSVPAPPGMQQTETSQQSNVPVQPGGGLDIMGMLSGFLGGGSTSGGGGGGGIAEMIAKVGSSFINNGNNKTSDKGSDTKEAPSAPRRKPRFKVAGRSSE